MTKCNINGIDNDLRLSPQQCTYIRIGISKEPYQAQFYSHMPSYRNLINILTIYLHHNFIFTHVSVFNSNLTLKSTRCCAIRPTTKYCMMLRQSLLTAVDINKQHVTSKSGVL